jgi:hypothetical protein
MTTQLLLTLPLAPPPRHLCPQALKVLAMLQAGPVTTGQFMERYIGRAAARILELRRAGYNITTRALPGRSSHLYTLEPNE